MMTYIDVRVVGESVVTANSVEGAESDDGTGGTRQ